MCKTGRGGSKRSPAPKTSSSESGSTGTRKYHVRQQAVSVRGQPGSRAARRRVFTVSSRLWLACLSPYPMGHSHPPKSSRHEDQYCLKMSCFYLRTKLRHNIYIYTQRKKYQKGVYKTLVTAIIIQWLWGCVSWQLEGCLWVAGWPAF